MVEQEVSNLLVGVRFSRPAQNRMDEILCGTSRTQGVLCGESKAGGAVAPRRGCANFQQKIMRDRKCNRGSPVPHQEGKVKEF